MNSDYRVVNIGEFKDYFIIKEVYYNDDEEVVGSSNANPCGNSVEELVQFANCILKASKKPVLKLEKGVKV
jgi:hypothetical protein